jgi:hypothetical protein
MTIEQPEKVDFISIKSSTNEVILTISDHLHWDTINEHFLILQEKINHYLAFVESGEILSAYPAAMGRSVVIDLVYKYPPDPQASDFLTKVEKFIHDAGFRFTHGGLSEREKGNNS